MRRGWIKVIKQAIWGVGPVGVSEQVAPGQKTSERSPPAAAHHKISQRTARTNRERNEGNERRTDSERGRQSSYRATESGARERKGNGCTLDHRPGHTITLRRGPPHAPSLGVGIACSLLGAVLQDRRMLPVECWALVACVRYTANHTLRSTRIRLCERGTPTCENPAGRVILSDRQRRQRVLPYPALTCVRAGRRHD
jgi:hypothetical protein